MVNRNSFGQNYSDAPSVANKDSILLLQLVTVSAVFLWYANRQQRATKHAIF